MNTNDKCKPGEPLSRGGGLIQVPSRVILYLTILLLEIKENIKGKVTELEIKENIKGKVAKLEIKENIKGKVAKLEIKENIKGKVAKLENL